MKDDELLELIRKIVAMPRIPSFVVDDHPRNLVFSARMDETYQLYLMTLTKNSGEDEKPIQLTKAEDGIIHGYDLSPSGRYLIFPRDKGGSENYQVFLMDLKSSLSEEICLTPSPVGRIWLNWFPDERKVLVTGSDDETNFVRVLDIQTRELETLFTCDSWIDSALSKDGKLVAVSTQRGENVKNRDVIVFPVKDPTDQRIISFGDESQEMGPAWSNDGKYLAFMTNAASCPRLVIWDVEQWQQHAMIDMPDEGDVFWPMMSEKEQNTVYLLIDHHGKERLYQCNIEEKSVKELFDASKGSIYEARVVNDKLFVISTSFTQPPRLEFYNLPDLTQFRRPFPETSFPSDLLSSFVFKDVWYSSFDSRDIQAWFINSDESGERPVIVKIHGGPTASTQNSWNPEITVLTLLGFSIFLPNYRGSTGFGPEFRLLNVGDLGGGDFKDVVYGVKWLQANGYLKKEKPSIIGGSYGGYMTVYALVRSPDLWKCGVAAVPVTDWIADYELATADFRFFDVYFFGGTPKEKRDLYVERSPITHVEQLQAPLLIIHGKNDSRCPFKPVKEFYETAKSLGKDIYLHSIEDEGHGSMKLANAIDDIFHEVKFLLDHYTSN